MDSFVTGRHSIEIQNVSVAQCIAKGKVVSVLN
jgi:hypothetical protein